MERGVYNLMLTSAQIVDYLRPLAPLQKQHYSWAEDGSLYLPENAELLYEYARITNGLSFKTIGVSQEKIDVAVRVCKQVNLGNPDIPCSIGINFSPWAYYYQLRPSERGEPTIPPTETGEPELLELTRMRRQFEDFSDMVAGANARLGIDGTVPIVVTTCMQDIEVWKVQRPNSTKVPDVGVYNAAISRKITLAFNLSLEIFPEAKVIQYDRGGWMNGSSQDGFMQDPLYTESDPCHYYSFSMYRVNEPDNMRICCRRTVASAKSAGINDVAVYLALGHGFSRQTNINIRKWEELEYPTVYSYLAGGELNHPYYGARPERFAEWDHVTAVVFHPSPFSAAYPNFPKHFIAYVMGANNLVIDLPEELK